MDPEATHSTDKKFRHNQRQSHNGSAAISMLYSPVQYGTRRRGCPWHRMDSDNAPVLALYGAIWEYVTIFGIECSIQPSATCICLTINKSAIFQIKKKDTEKQYLHARDKFG